ncbi:MAG: hypothetical protein MO852_10445, partial [Candidatus Devosia euplotis]|nr:hypothetical protein [Candidatus Devosia euplotis]
AALRRGPAGPPHKTHKHLPPHLGGRLLAIYGPGADPARPRQTVADHLPHLFDGHEIIAMTECSLMAPLDARAKT